MTWSNMWRRGVRLVLIALVIAMGTSHFATQAIAGEGELVDHVLAAVERDRGMCVVVGETDGALSIGLAKRSGWTVQGTVWEPAGLRAVRARFAEALVDDRVSVIAGTGDGLPYADGLINLFVAPGWGEKAVAVEEVLRVLAPGGVAVVGHDGRTGAVAELPAVLKKLGVADVRALPRNGWYRFVKPVDPAFDVWSHRLGGADLSSVNNDKKVAPWSEVRWIGDPRWGSLYISYMGRVTDGGRLYYKENRAAGAAGTQTWLVARDAYNGFELWRVPAGEPFEKSYFNQDDTLTCDGEAVYSVEDNVLRARDGRHGKPLRVFEPGFVPATVTSAGPVLLASSKTRAVALDKTTGKALWSTAAKSHPATDGSDVYVLGSTDLEAYELQSGKLRWKTKAATANGNPQLFCKGSVVYLGFKPTWTPMTLLSAYDTREGTHLWSQERPPNGYGVLPYKDELVMLTRDNGTKGDNVFVRVLDPRTGNARREYQATGLVGGHCFTSKGAGNFLVYSNSWYLDRESGSTVEANTVRSPCRLGQMPANGLTYFLPQHCDCKVFLRGFLAMAPAGGKTWVPEKLADPVPTVSAAAPQALSTTADDWPLYRHDAKRSNASATKGPLSLRPLWSQALAKSRLTQAVSAFGIVCVAEPRTGRVWARDAITGAARWVHHAEGRVDYPPALHRGLCIFGTSSGSVVALDAQTGAEVWRLRAAPAEKYIAEEGRFASAWPVVGGVLPVGDDIYFHCGRAQQVDGGLRMFAVEAATGKVRWRVAGGGSADLFTSDDSELMLTKTFYRTKDGGRVLGAKKSTGLLHTTAYLSPVSVLDYMASVEPALTSHRHVDLTDGRVTGEALAFNDTFGLAAWRYRFGVPAALMKKNKPNARFLYAVKDRQVLWQMDEELPLQMVGMALAGDTAYLAGLPTSQKPGDRSELWVLSATDGQKRQSLPLEGTPTYDALSLAHGRLYLTTEEGQLMCWGDK